jgi:hypothetical protein
MKQAQTVPGDEIFESRAGSGGGPGGQLLISGIQGRLCHFDLRPSGFLHPNLLYVGPAKKDENGDGRKEIVSILRFS